MDAELFDKVYDSIVKKESTYDGIYYTGVKTTRIVCRPSCRAKTPKKENITLYPSVEAAIRDGFRPCKRCKPETPGALGPDGLLAAQTDAVIDACYGERITLQQIAQKLAISPYHLQRTYKRVTGLTPMERLHQTRLSAAKRLLESGRLTMSEVAAAVGFRSASHFAVWFRRLTRVTPSAYREGHRGNRQALAGWTRNWRDMR
ncbi:bifunctional transcriptional activator/DNA repair enzyme AdaA [Brevibacillus massiliensis]|jgi:AraC family transcriptional regulator of adaptative response / methylphosphotriester-DNA alkyltransferase methyltransferase|uniref:bifunctional transcriptional activator/DNA repair enzyme AdaA n=1 Tax=Brevibacillus massiliensis TaxID=1118054 RepID=UPI00031D77D6|nr:Ada metal-binding domain-containing protein [Brevibacillus massiliensis]